ncbi:MltA domain-containing protein [Aurantimonas sp. Leaf443]|uniref:murein transglycosylase A n=1 Tax=Aurantimonas sp. Leaf443 TaxID=1736378 RepID=UPI0006F3A980|nr:MltA domain-containing protein [Aurantimonas sp. Leaf443]KQT85554.1 transglycosylase [Aurantimonas sp. Leaf443]
MTTFRPLPFSALEGWRDFDPAPAFSAFRASAARLLSGALPTGALGIEGSTYHGAARRALAGASDPRAFFETEFELLEIRPPEATGSEPGFLTGYYEPVAEASPVETARFRVPLYAPPEDLVKVDDVNRPPGFDPEFRFARRKPCGLLEEYPDRASIEAGLLKGRSLEIAWLEDPVEAFFVHVQGSARLRLTDGRTMRVGYAAKTGHPFTAIGRHLVQTGALTLAEADMAGIRRWLAAHPERLREVLDRNRSFIFFSRFEVPDESLGPVGAAKVSLTPLASIAVDRLLHSYGVPLFVSAPGLLVEERPFRRLCIAQDTGSAILGPARADLFVGSGSEAGALAGAVRHRAAFHLLAPAPLAARLSR